MFHPNSQIASKKPATATKTTTEHGPPGAILSIRVFGIVAILPSGGDPAALPRIDGARQALLRSLNPFPWFRIALYAIFTKPDGDYFELITNVKRN